MAYQDMIKESYLTEFLYGVMVCYAGLKDQANVIKLAKELIEKNKENRKYFYYTPTLVPYLVHPELKHLF